MNRLAYNAPVWQDCRTLIDTAATQVPLDGVMMINDLPAGTEVFADPLIQKVFYNLIDNALHYGGEKMTKIRFFSYPKLIPGLTLVCEDDGDGITKEDKKHLFERGSGKTPRPNPAAQPTLFSGKWVPREASAWSGEIRSSER